MRRWNSLFNIILFTAVVAGCERKKEPELNWEWITKQYSHNPLDSLKLSCANFLKENMSDIASEKAVFFNNNNGEAFHINLDTVSNQDHLKAILTKNNLAITTRRIPDSLIVTNDFLEQNIESVVSIWNKYPWSQNVPKDIFLNYLLPYKVLDEYPENWREEFSQKYKRLIDSCLAEYKTNKGKQAFYTDPNEIYYKTVVDDAGKWFHYDANTIPLTSRPGLSEMMCLKKGDCIPESFLSVYILRSLGIPAALDMIPYWGSKNAGHFGVVFLKNGKMVAPSGREIRNPAKVFRTSYKEQSLWKDSIKPCLQNRPFILKHLQNNHWLDVTSEHTLTTNIKYEFADSISAPFAYICVMDYGEWKPIYWGKINEKHTALFKNMGCRMLYHVAIPKNDSYEIVGKIFMISETGKMLYKKPNYRNRITMQLSKVNNGKNSFVEKGKVYGLYIYDSNNKWKLLNTKHCDKDNIITFYNVPANGLYKLIDKNGDRKLERIFSYENNRQIWW